MMQFVEMFTHATVLVLVLTTTALGKSVHHRRHHKEDAPVAKGGPGCGGRPAELFFLLDSSSSIWEPDFHTQLQFVAEVVDMFDIGPNHTRVGVATFSNLYYRQFGLNRYQDKQELKEAILRIAYRGGETMTGNAIRYMREEEFDHDVVREGVAKIAIILTDGRSRRPSVTEHEALKTKLEDINVFAIGIGNKFDYNELRKIGSMPEEKFVFEVGSYDTLASIKEELALGACEVQAAIPIMVGDQPACHSATQTDVVFVFDSSSVGSVNTGYIQDYIGSVVDEFNFADDVMRAGVVSKNCHEGDIELGEHTDKDEFAKDLRNRDFPELSKVIRKMRRHSFTEEQGSRPDARRMAVVFVDDKLEVPKRVFSEIKKTKSDDIEVFVVAIGDDVDMDEVNTMASSSNHVLNIPSYDVMRDGNLDLIDTLCADL